MDQSRNALLDHLRRFFGVIGLLWSGLRQFFFGVLPLAGIAALVFLLAREVRREDIEVAPIAVPAKLVDAGLSPEVVALRLLDQLEETARVALAENPERPTTELAGAQPDFNVPIAGMSLRSTAQLVRRVLGYPERRVTGEVVLEPGDRLSLRLRLSGHGQIVDLRGYGGGDLERLLRDAAPLVWRPLSPRLYAWWVAEKVEDQQAVRERLSALRRSDMSTDPRTDRTVTFLTGRSLVRSAQSRDALALFEQLVRDHPNWAASWSGRALARANLNQAAGAIEDLRKAVAVDPRWVAGHAQLANVLRNAGQPTEALAAAEVALALDPNDLTALFAQANALRDLRRSDQAVAAARRLVATRPSNPGAHSLLGWALTGRNDHTAALAAFDSGLALSPRSAELLSGRSEALRLLNRPEEALAAADAAYAVAPTGWYVLVTRGWALRRVGRHQDALVSFEAAIEQAGHVLWSYYGRAVSLVSLGRREEAEIALRRLIDMDRENLTNARRELDRLLARPAQ